MKRKFKRQTRNKRFDVIDICLIIKKKKKETNVEYNITKQNSIDNLDIIVLFQHPTR